GGRPRPIPRGGRGPDGLAGEGEGGRRSPRRGRRTSGRDDGGRRNRLRDRARISPRDRGGRRGRHAFLSRGRVGVGMAAWLFHFALVAYAVAAVRHLATVVRDRKESAAWADRAIALGFVLHGASVALRMVEIVRGGPFHFSVGLSLLAFLTVGVYLLAGRGLPLLGACVAPLVVGILLPAHAIPEITASTPTWLGWARPVHIGVALAGLALFGLGFLVSIFYLLLQRELKARRPGTMFR